MYASNFEFRLAVERAVGTLNAAANDAALHGSAVMQEHYKFEAQKLADAAKAHRDAET